MSSDLVLACAVVGPTMSVKHIACADVLVLAGLVGHDIRFTGDVLLQDRDQRGLLEVVNHDGLGGSGSV